MRSGLARNSFFCLFILIFTVEVNEIRGFSIKQDYSRVTNLTRSRRQTDRECKGFRCSSGECIKLEDRCDGYSNCKDGSDEFDDCKTAVACPGLTFTCNYGACVDGDAKCDGHKDCRDNSDEAYCESNCKSDQFQCLSGQCISMDDICDGVADCEDGSDETRQLCLNKYCPQEFTHKCVYGACVEIDAKCDGKKQCFDNSDEEGCETPTPTEVPSKPTSGTCLLPALPDNGYWQVQGVGGDGLRPGMVVPVNTLVLFFCNQGYLRSSDFIACFQKGWSAPPPTCSVHCPPLYNTKTTIMKCYNKEDEDISCDRATAGAKAKYECAPYYEPSEKIFETRHCLEEGLWNLPQPRCIPVCGQKRVTAEILIVNPEVVVKGDYPWVAAIFQESEGSFVNVCGGSILSQKVILTAAHCVTNNYGEALAPAKIRVGVGKYYNRFKDERDIYAQYSDVEEVRPHHNFKGDFRKFSYDIACLITKQILLLSNVVQPICFSNLRNIKLANGTEGIVTGWGYTTASGHPSDELKQIHVPFKDETTCFKELPVDFADTYHTMDKFCAGHYNKSTAVCKGDSGGGLVFEDPRDKRYYVHGIVSLTKKTVDGCDIELSSLYTKVATYYDWLEEVASKHRPDFS